MQTLVLLPQTGLEQTTQTQAAVLRPHWVSQTNLPLAGPRLGQVQQGLEVQPPLVQGQARRGQAS